MTEFIQATAFGLLIGGVYALFASGLTLIFGVMKVINIAHGALLILGAFLAFTLWEQFGLDPLASILITAPAMFVLGLALYVTMIGPLRSAPLSSTVLLTFGLALVIEAVMGLVWGNNSRSARPVVLRPVLRPLGDHPAEGAGVRQHRRDPRPGPALAVPQPDLDRPCDPGRVRERAGRGAGRGQHRAGQRAHLRRRARHRRRRRVDGLGPLPVPAGLPLHLDRAGAQHHRPRRARQPPGGRARRDAARASPRSTRRPTSPRPGRRRCRTC